MNTYDLKEKLSSLLKIIINDSQRDYKDFCLDISPDVYNEFGHLYIDFGIKRLVDKVPADKIARNIFVRYWHRFDVCFGESAKQKMLEQSASDIMREPKYQKAIEKDIDHWINRSQSYFEVLMLASGITYDVFFKMLAYLPIEEQWILQIAERYIKTPRARKVIETLASIARGETLTSIP